MFPRCASLVQLVCLPLAGCYWMIWDPQAEDYPDTALAEYSCGPGEVRRLSSGLRFDNLAEALADANLVDGFCLGEGEHTVASLNWEPGVSWGEESSLRLVGSGAERTILRGEITAAAPGYTHLTLDIDGGVELEGVGVEALHLRVLAGRASLSDIRLDTAGSRGPLLTVSSSALEIDGLSIVGVSIEAGSPLVFHGVGTVAGLVLTDNRLASGQLFEVYGQILLVEPEITGNLGLSDEVGVVAIQAFGGLRILGGQLTDNDLSGPLIYGWEQLELTDVELSNNSCGWLGVVELTGPALVSGGRVLGNLAGAAAFGLSEPASLQLDGVDFGLGAERNLPCDVATLYSGHLLSQCIGDGLGDDATLSCDRSGCR